MRIWLRAYLAVMLGALSCAPRAVPPTRTSPPAPRPFLRPPEELVAACLGQIRLNEDTLSSVTDRLGSAQPVPEGALPGQVLCYQLQRPGHVVLLHAGSVDGRPEITGVDVMTQERARTLTELEGGLTACTPLPAHIQENALFPLVRVGMTRRTARRLLGSPYETRGATESYTVVKTWPAPDGGSARERFEGVEVIYERDRIVQLSIFRVHLS
jgi:hypothetical protein